MRKTPAPRRNSLAHSAFSWLATLMGMLTTLLSLAIGCKNSSPAESTPAARIAASAAPSPRPQVMLKLPNRAPPLDRMVPVKTFQVTPPASFGSGQLSPGSEVEFLVQGNGGQFLRVDVTELDRISIQPPLASFTTRAPGRCPSSGWLYSLPETGMYRILFAPVTSPKIGFSFLRADDPLLDPGITASQVSINLRAFAQKEQLSVVPYNYQDDEGYYDSWPTHIGVQEAHFEFHVMTVSGYKKTFGQDQQVDRLEAALRPPNRDVSVEALPYASTNHWCGYITSFRKQILEGDGWRGLRWVGGFGGDEEYPSCGLGYVFVGLTNDNQYLIKMRSDISHSDQNRLRPKRKIMGPPGQTWEASDTEAETAARLKLEKALAAADPSSFSPGLDQLDAVIRSLKFTQPAESPGWRQHHRRPHPRPPGAQRSPHGDAGRVHAQEAQSRVKAMKRRNEL